MNGGDTFGGRFRAARLALGLSQDVLADQLGVTKAAVSQWELGNKAPRFESWPRIRQVLHADLDHLIVGWAAGEAQALWRVTESPPPSYQDKAHPVAEARMKRFQPMFLAMTDAQQRMLLDMAKLFTEQNTALEEAEAALPDDGPEYSNDPD